MTPNARPDRIASRARLRAALNAARERRGRSWTTWTVDP